MFFIPLIFWSRTCCRVQHGPYSVVILRRSAWSGSSLFGLAALFCVALVSVVPRCECELVCIIARVLHLVSHVDVPLPLRSKHRGTIVSPSLTLLLVGRTGWLHYLQRRRNHLPAPPARTASLRSSPSLPSPRTPRPGLMSGEILFKI